MTTLAQPRTDEHWYHLDDLPAGRVVVRVAWDAYEIKAARLPHPKRKRLEWCEMVEGEVRWLPREGWSLEPQEWQPLDARMWTWPKGTPVPQPIERQVSERMWSATMRFTAVDDAEAADLAAEMERDRNLARSGGAAAGEAHAGGMAEPQQQWWFDPHLVTYSRPGHITEREAEGRLMRAFAAERWVRVERPTCNTFGGILANLARTVPLSPAELAAADPLPIRDEPTGRDRDDMLTALSWLKGLPTSWFAENAGDGRVHWAGPYDDVLRQRSMQPPRSWREIGRVLKVSHEQARQMYAQALALVTDSANGRTTTAALRRAERLAAVQEGNRMAKRRG